jgi:hypothetical protein
MKRSKIEFVKCDYEITHSGSGTEKVKIQARRQWLTPAILATQ